MAAAAAAAMRGRRGGRGVSVPATAVPLASIPAASVPISVPATAVPSRSLSRSRDLPAPLRSRSRGLTGVPRSLSSSLSTLAEDEEDDLRLFGSTRRRRWRLEDALLLGEHEAWLASAFAVSSSRGPVGGLERRQ